MVKRPTTFSMRMPEDLNQKIQEYATEHSCTKAEAMSHFARAGIDLEERGETGGATEGGDADAALQKIQERLEALQNLPTVEAPSTTAIVPVDIRDRIQAYSSEHECSEQEALTYYARIGIQMSGDERAATSVEVAELSRRLDAIAQDSMAKGEQLKQMGELISQIAEYTKPEELEIEGEVADDAEDVEQAELTDEERQAIADEHTRRVVTDILDERDRRLADQQQTSPQTSLNPWIPVLVAVIASLIIGLIVILTR